jgi:hypothetical protein
MGSNKMSSNFLEYSQSNENLNDVEDSINDSNPEAKDSSLHQEKAYNIRDINEDIFQSYEHVNQLD